MTRTGKASLVMLPFVVLALLVAYLTSWSGAEAHSPSVSVTGVGTATIDGVIGAGEWNNAGTVNSPVNLQGGGTTPGTLFVMNDATNLYHAVRFNVAATRNSAVFEFDNDHGGAPLVNGDDALLINPELADFCPDSIPPPLCGSIFLDQFFSTAPLSFGLIDVSDGGTNDGAGAFSNGGGVTVHEFSHPLDSADDAHDFSLQPGDTVGFTLFIRLLGGGLPITDTTFPAPLPQANNYGDIIVASLDTTPPETSITSAADGNEDPVANGASTLSPAITFTFEGTDDSGSGVAGFECSLDAAAFSSCTSPISFTGLAVGSHTLRVQAIDAADNIDPTPASFAWTILTPDEELGNIEGEVQGMMNRHPGTPLADKVEDALAKVRITRAELNKTPVDNQAAVGSLEGAEEPVPINKA